MTVGKDILLLSMLTLAFSREGKVIPQTQRAKTNKKKKGGKFQLTSGVKSQQCFNLRITARTRKKLHQLNKFEGL